MEKFWIKYVSNGILKKIKAKVIALRHQVIFNKEQVLKFCVFCRGNVSESTL